MDAAGGLNRGEREFESMTDAGSSIRAYLQAHIDEHGFLSWLNVSVTAVESGHLEMEVPFDKRLTNPEVMAREDRPTVHGGVASTLVDTAGGLAVRSELPDPLSTGVTTIDLNVSYLRPSTDTLVATADTIRVGRTIGVAGVEVTSTADDGDQTPVAVGRGSYRIFRDGTSD